MRNEPKRACPFCAEEVSHAAKLCPRCRQWLSMRSFRHPLTATFAVVLPVLAVLFLIVAGIRHTFERLGNPRPHFSEFVNPIKILESHMNWVETSSGLRIYLVGILTNQSQQAWSGIEFDCRFFDRMGVLIDAADGWGRLTVLPGDDAAFRTSIVPTRATNSYASFSMSVSNARNTKGFF